MLPWLDAVPANPSSVHRSGQRARAAVETAREAVAAALGGAPGEIVFTSGATEADALALQGTLDARADDRRGAMVVSAAEHDAVRQAAWREAARGRPLVWLPPGPHGAPTPDVLEAHLARLEGPAALVAVMHTNNETGAVADVPALAAVAHAHGAAFLCDAVQAFGATPLDVGALGADLVAVSAHKIGGPQGVGALWVRDGHPLTPQAVGGGQERGRRAGTHAVAPIVGFGVAAHAAARDAAARGAHYAALRDRLEAAVTALPGVARNGGEPRGPKHLNVRVEGVDGDALRIALDGVGVEVSAGSACSAGSLEPSHVLLAMGLPRAAAKASLRFSVGEGLDAAAIDDAAARVAGVVTRLRAAPF